MGDTDSSKIISMMWTAMGHDVKKVSKWVWSFLGGVCVYIRGFHFAFLPDLYYISVTMTNMKDCERLARDPVKSWTLWKELWPKNK